MIEAADRSPDLLVVGAGVIGVCSAYYAVERGLRVVLVDRMGVAAGSSYGNAGWIVPGHVIPLARPGALGAGLRSLFDPETPFFRIRPRLDRDLLAWGWRFRGACTEAHLRRGIRVLRELGAASSALARELSAPDPAAWGYEQRGLLLVYRTEARLRQATADARLAAAAGVALRVLEAPQLQALEPCLRPGILGGVHVEEDAHLDPARFVRGLAARVEARGGTIRPGVEVIGFETEGRRIAAVETTRGTFRPGQVVLAAGAWSPGVARSAGIPLLVQGAKGYSLTYRRPDRGPSHPMLLDDARVAVTPMGDRLRVSGTFELVGLDLSIDPRRLRALPRAVETYLALDPRTLELEEIWRGLRPVTPDGLPLLGRAPRLDNLIVATGHATLGVSLGPVTGQVVADLAAGRSPAVDLEPLRVDRFGRGAA